MGASDHVKALLTLPHPAAEAALLPQRRFALLKCGKESDYVKRVHGSYFDIYLSLLREDGEEWSLYNAVAGELPGAAGGNAVGGDEALDAYDGFVVTGSCADAHSDEAWVLALVELLRRAIARGKRVLGICFGHQVLCRALGGKTGRSASGWDIGVTCIHPTPSGTAVFDALRISAHLPVLEFHRDEVLELPPLAEVLAASGRTAVEMFRYGDIVLGIQGHPEYTADVIDDFISRLYKQGWIQDSHVEEARESLRTREPSREEWKTLCRAFLKGRLQL